jgi:hypothetical protein
MKRLIAFALILAPFAPLVFAPQARAADVRATNPNAFNLEFFGRGLLFAFSYDRAFGDRIVAGAGFGRSPMRTLADVDAGVSATLIPVYVNLYLSTEGSSFFVMGGVFIVINFSDIKNLKATYSGLEFGSMSVLL